MENSEKDSPLAKENKDYIELEKLIHENCQHFIRAKNIKQKRGFARILKAHIEMWLERPEYPADLRKGLSPKKEPSYRSNQVSEDAEYPFDKPGHTRKLYFYCSSSGVTSELFSQEQIETNPYAVFKHYGYIVITYEKLYASAIKTSQHFSSAAAFKMHINPETINVWGKKNKYDVLADPQGCPDSRFSLCAFTTNNLKEAVKKADELSEKYKIRFLAAKVIKVMDIH